jgi:hypothetical protein
MLREVPGVLEGCLEGQVGKEGAGFGRVMCIFMSLLGVLESQHRF